MCSERRRRKTDMNDLHSLVMIMILGAAAVSDLRFWRISNRLLLAGAAIMTAVHMMEPSAADLRGLLPGIMLEALMLLLFKHHMTGGGDVKLNALILYAMPNASGVRILVLGMLFAAGYGIWKLWRRGMWTERIRHMQRFLQKNIHKEKYAYYLKERDGTGPAIPMAVFMLLAACLTVSAG